MHTHTHTHTHTNLENWSDMGSNICEVFDFSLEHCNDNYTSLEVRPLYFSTMLTCLATCIAVNVLRSMEEELCPLDVRRLEGEEGAVSPSRRGPGDWDGVRGRG